MNEWDRQYRSNDGFRRWPWEAVVACVSRRYAAVPREERRGIRMLDLGCGAGGNLFFLASEGFRAVGLDSSQEALR